MNTTKNTIETTKNNLRNSTHLKKFHSKYSIDYRYL